MPSGLIRTTVVSGLIIVESNIFSLGKGGEASLSPEASGKNSGKGQSPPGNRMFIPGDQGQGLTRNTDLVVFLTDKVDPLTEWFYYSYDNVNWNPIDGMVRKGIFYDEDYKTYRDSTYIPIILEDYNLGRVHFKYSADKLSEGLNSKVELLSEAYIDEYPEDPLSPPAGKSCSCKSLRPKFDGDNAVPGMYQLGPFKKDPTGVAMPVKKGDPIGPDEGFGFGFSWIGETEEVDDPDGGGIECKEKQEVQSTITSWTDATDVEVRDALLIYGPLQAGVQRRLEPSLRTSGGKPNPGAAFFGSGTYALDNYENEGEGKRHFPNGSIATSDHPTVSNFVAENIIRIDQFKFTLSGVNTCTCTFIAYSYKFDGKFYQVTPMPASCN